MPLTNFYSIKNGKKQFLSPSCVLQTQNEELQLIFSFLFKELAVAVEVVESINICSCNSWGNANDVINCIREQSMT